MSGKKGRSGRKTLPFKQRCTHLADTVVLEEVERYLRETQLKGDPSDATWQYCANYVSKYRIPDEGEQGEGLEDLSDAELGARLRSLEATLRAARTGEPGTGV